MRVQVGDVALFFDVDGEKLRVDGAGLREAPTLILLHGGPGFDHSGFKPAFATLADVAQVIYLDHRGHGRSDASTPDKWNLERWGDDVRAFCDALGIVRPVVYGLSFGGMVAQSYAIRHPGHAAKIILDSTAPRMRLDLSYDMFERLGGRNARDSAVRFWTNPEDPAALEEYLRVCMPLYTRKPSDPDALKRTMLRPEPLSHFFGSGGEGHRFDFRARLPQMATPTLVLSGLQDPITPSPLSEEIAAAVANCQLEQIPDCGHGVYRDAPRKAFELIRQFIS